MGWANVGLQGGHWRQARELSSGFLNATFTKVLLALRRGFAVKLSATSLPILRPQP